MKIILTLQVSCKGIGDLQGSPDHTLRTTELGKWVIQSSELQNKELKQYQILSNDQYSLKIFVNIFSFFIVVKYILHKVYHSNHF